MTPERFKAKMQSKYQDILQQIEEFKQWCEGNDPLQKIDAVDFEPGIPEEDFFSEAEYTIEQYPGKAVCLPLNRVGEPQLKLAQQYLNEQMSNIMIKLFFEKKSIFSELQEGK